MSALVTGGAQGIGLAISKALLRSSFKVALLDYNADVGRLASEELKKEFGKDKVLFIHCDVTKKEQLASAYSETVKTFGGLDVVCNNAGIADEVHEEKLIAVNLTAVIQSSKLAFEYMSTRKGGRGGVIVNMSSITGLHPEMSGPAPVYAATKCGIIGYTIATQGCHESDGIRVNCVCPTFTDTPLLKNIANSSFPPELIKGILSGSITLSPEYVADAVLKTIQDTSMNGALLELTKEEGTTIVELKPTKLCQI